MVRMSDNVTGADNQQERLGSTESANWFLAGFIEGEGSVCVSVKRHRTCRHGYYVDPGVFRTNTKVDVRSWSWLK